MQILLFQKRLLLKTGKVIFHFCINKVITSYFSFWEPHGLRTSPSDKLWIMLLTFPYCIQISPFHKSNCPGKMNRNLGQRETSETLRGWRKEKVLEAQTHLPVHILSRGQQIRQEKSTFPNMQKACGQRCLHQFTIHL